MKRRLKRGVRAVIMTLLALAFWWGLLIIADNWDAPWTIGSDWALLNYVVTCYILFMGWIYAQEEDEKKP